MSIKNYNDLIVWQKSIDLAVDIYKLVPKLPKTEMFGIVSQMTRAAVSIPSNIAEGHSRNSTKEFLRFLAIAQGSKAELETQILICQRIKYLTELDIITAMTDLSEVGKMLSSLMKKLRTKLTNNVIGRTI